jgi:hypothetical protein
MGWSVGSEDPISGAVSFGWPGPASAGRDPASPASGGDPASSAGGGDQGPTYPGCWFSLPL